MSVSNTPTGAPAFRKLLAGFIRWQKEVHHAEDEKGIEDLTEKSLRRYPLEQAPPSTPPPAAIHFLWSVTQVDLDQLPADHPDCEICHKKFSSLEDRDGNAELEVAARLPCGQ